MADKKTPPPLDYSFYDIETLTGDCKNIEPRPSINVKTPRKSSKKQAEQEDGTRPKSKTTSVRLNNNNLTDLNGLKGFLEEILENPEDLQWLDVSCNSLTKIDEIICDYENLEILYLHGNSITDIGEVDKLQRLQKLKKLTIHANPVIVDNTSYKNYVLSLLPSLINLNHTGVSRGDLVTAKNWKKMNGDGKKKKIKRED